GLIPIGKVFKGVGKPALNMMSKTAGKTTAGQLMKSGLKNTTNMTTNRLIKLKTSYKVMMDKANVGYRVASAIERLEGKKEAIEMAGKSWYRGQKERLIKYVDEKMVPQVHNIAYKGANHYNKVNEALSKLGMAPKYAYAGIGTETAKKITKQDIDRYIQKASAKLTNKGTSTAVKSGTEGSISLTKNKGKPLKVDDKDAHLITRVEYTEKEHMMWKNGKALKPNVEYVTPEGHLYRTDDLGRIKYVEVDNLYLKKGKRKPHMQRVVGRIFRRKDDDGGHLIALQFSGSGDIDNLVAMHSGINRAGGEWYEMEKDWANALKEIPPKQVKVKIEPVYSGDSLRPDRFKVRYTIGEEKHFKNIVNEG
ncbi:DNA/RNA non-specific endonuclease, partial [Macrococcus capreoli]|uniref:DNA/RNA non-specific endonuclease n=1 Tax=Macrococcus capreoli TaxID=2982690 RepID=UPI0021D5F224